MLHTRRTFFQAAAGTAAALLVRPTIGSAQASSGFVLPKLPYAFDALEPHIDSRTMEIHHGRHHQAYVDNLNAALKNHPDWLTKPVDEVIRNLGKLPETIREAVRNNGGGHANHSHFWLVMKKDGGGQPSGELLKAIETAFGTFEGFQKAFTDAAMKRFGSGWAWLVVGGEKGLSVLSSPNQDTPVMDGKPNPILGLDVWEHAYYLKYQNKRADYIKAWWNVVNWDAVAANYAAAKKG
jgi:Fe-Mn family superoxide dismutase